MGYISTRMMECEDAFSDMGSLRQNLELPPEYAYDDGETLGPRGRDYEGLVFAALMRILHAAHLVFTYLSSPIWQMRTASWRMPWC